MRCRHDRCVVGDGRLCPMWPVGLGTSCRRGFLCVKRSCSSGTSESPSFRNSPFGDAGPRHREGRLLMGIRMPYFFHDAGDRSSRWVARPPTFRVEVSSIPHHTRVPFRPAGTVCGSRGVASWPGMAGASVPAKRGSSCGTRGRPRRGPVRQLPTPSLLTRYRARCVGRPPVGTDSL